MTDADVETAQRLLTEGSGVDAVVHRLRAAGLGTLQLIKVLREATGLHLPDAITVVEATREGRSLAHLTRERLPLLARARQAGGRWASLYCNAQLADAPWLTMIPGRADASGLGSVYFWALPEPPPTADLWLREMMDPATPEQRREFQRRLEHDAELASTHPGSISGPRVRHDDLRRALRDRLDSDPFWRDHVAIVRDTDSVLTCRFRLSPA